MNTKIESGDEHALAGVLRLRLLEWVLRKFGGSVPEKVVKRLSLRIGVDVSGHEELLAHVSGSPEALLVAPEAVEEYLASLGLVALGRTFALTTQEQWLLAALVQLELDAELGEWLTHLGDTIGHHWHAHLHLLSGVLQIHRRVLARLLSPRASLARMGLVDVHRRPAIALESRFPVRDEVIEYCGDGTHDLERVTASFFTPCGGGTLGLADYPQLGSGLDRVLGMLRTRAAGTHLLLHGPPGTGKTELALALARELGLSLYAVPCQDQDDEPIEHHARLVAFAQAQLVLGARPDALLLFDEVEDVIRSSNVSRDGKHRSVSFKGWLHEQLERAPLPSIWISNSLAGFDAAQLRRFACILEVPVPGLERRRALVASATQDLGLDPALLEGLSRRTDLPPAELAAIGREARQCTDAPVAFIDATRSRLRASGRPRLRNEIARDYDLRFVRCEPSLPHQFEAFSRLSGARVLLSGPPGSGKTALAAHFALTAERPLLVKRASDLLSPWLGETEQNLARAFEEAEADDAVLLLDEADSFLGARHEGQRSWERSQVNELLKQLEDFDGWFFAATNLPETLDPAAMRRFDFKLRFGWLEIGARLAMVEDFLAREHIVHATDSTALRRALLDLPYLLPGDLAAIRRRVQAFADSIDLDQILGWLGEEHAAKPEARQRSIGFTRVA